MTKTPIIENLFYEGDVMCISSSPGMGKSILALQFICCLTTGVPFLDTYSITRPYNVLYIQTEGDRCETMERLTHMNKKLLADDTRWVHMNLPGLSINTDRGLQELLRLAAAPKMDYDVVLLDPIYTTVKGTMSSDEVATDWVRNMRQLKSRFDCSIIAFHHEGKENWQGGQLIEKRMDTLFGSTFWGAFFNSNFKMRVRAGVHELESGKQRSGRLIDKIEMVLIEPSPLMYVPKDDVSGASLTKVKALLSGSTEWLSIKEIQSRTELSRATVYRSITQLKDGVDKSLAEGLVKYIGKKVSHEEES